MGQACPEIREIRVATYELYLVAHKNVPNFAMMLNNKIQTKRSNIFKEQS